MIGTFLDDNLISALFSCVRMFMKMYLHKKESKEDMFRFPHTIMIVSVVS